MEVLKMKDYNWDRLYIYNRAGWDILEIERMGSYYYVFEDKGCRIADGFEKILDIEGVKELIRRLKKSGRYYFDPYYKG
jgi:hypothetical protein